MQQLIYFRYVEEVVDPRVLAMQELEHDVVCRAHQFQIPHHTPEDLAQELRVILWDALPRFDPAKATLRTWGNRVMLNRLRNIHKRECLVQKRKDWLAVSLDLLDL